ncbi:hydroxyacylglutathione hydrolase [Marinomonas piezotolerans]|uniref:Hydroxyacylglutathione hydrolase n=1 Tax=Marinomonas piezotolerans TaxID=2213058 RepID=A0A370U608_9GAMM|nr:hydroxyacylglutathione hydrolase [Marinomonas piezotolerans]RDL43183.1 hydroxyacylglutathione hydrolase [Marinomonas piezotolerans]
MTFIPLPAFNDNYIWITHNREQKHIWVVDPGDAEVVDSYCKQNACRVAGILITHHHKDHIGGVKTLVDNYDCEVFGPRHLAPEVISRPLEEGDCVTVDGEELLVLATPGHTLDHLCYVGQSSDTPFILCGDTLFRGGCGRLFEGSPAQMLQSLTRLRQLPGDTLVYGTHEYTLANYRFARAIDPDNVALQNSEQQAARLRANHTPTLPSTIAVEQQTNPFLRFDVASVVRGAAELLGEAPASDLIGAFAQIRRAKDGF